VWLQPVWLRRHHTPTLRGQRRTDDGCPSVGTATSALLCYGTLRTTVSHCSVRLDGTHADSDGGECRQSAPTVRLDNTESSLRARCCRSEGVLGGRRWLPLTWDCSYSDAVLHHAAHHCVSMLSRVDADIAECAVPVGPDCAPRALLLFVTYRTSCVWSGQQLTHW